MRCWCPAVLWSPSAARLRAQAVLFAAMGFKAIFKIISLTSSTIIINLARPQPAAVGFSLLPSSRMRVCLCHICERGGREGCCAAPPATPTHCTLDFYLQTAAGAALHCPCSRFKVEHRRPVCKHGKQCRTTLGARRTRHAARPGADRRAAGGQAAPRDQMGAVNGMAMALASLSRALGPAVGGAAWAVCVSLPNGLTFTGFAAMVRLRATVPVTQEPQQARTKLTWRAQLHQGRGGGVRSGPHSLCVAAYCGGRPSLCLAASVCSHQPDLHMGVWVFGAPRSCCERWKASLPAPACPHWLCGRQRARARLCVVALRVRAARDPCGRRMHTGGRPGALFAECARVGRCGRRGAEERPRDAGGGVRADAAVLPPREAGVSGRSAPRHARSRQRRASVAAQAPRALRGACAAGRGAAAPRRAPCKRMRECLRGRAERLCWHCWQQ